MKKSLFAFLIMLSAFVSSSVSAAINAADTIILDLSAATCTGAYTRIPVYFSSNDTIYTVDFSLKYNHVFLAYDSTVKLKTYFSMAANYNVTDSIVRFTSVGFQEMENHTPLIYMYFDLLSGKINAAHFYSMSAWLNGETCSIRVINAVSGIGLTANGPTTFNTGDSVLLTAPPGTGYAYQWSTGSTTQSIIAKTTDIYTLTITNPNGCSTDFSASVNAMSQLPVQWLSFTAIQVDEKVQLDWTTAIEVNNDYFTIERSTDGIGFEAIERVSAKGFSNGISSYSTLDHQPVNGISYYRLRQTDFDQWSDLSKTIIVNFQKTTMLILYPNPASDVLYININWLKSTSNNEEFILSIQDLGGRMVIHPHTVKLYYGMLYPLDISTLARGIYTVNLANAMGTHRQQVVIE